MPSPGETNQDVRLFYFRLGAGVYAPIINKNDVFKKAFSSYKSREVKEGMTTTKTFTTRDGISKPENNQREKPKFPNVLDPSLTKENSDPCICHQSKL